MVESKSDPCKGCKNGPKPGSWCTGCRNFAYACELHVIDPSTLNIVNTDMTRTPSPDTESKPCVYSEEQKEVIKQHLDFFCRIINFALRNNMPFDASKVAFLQSILREADRLDIRAASMPFDSVKSGDIYLSIHASNNPPSE